MPGQVHGCGRDTQWPDGCALDRALEVVELVMHGQLLAPPFTGEACFVQHLCKLVKADSYVAHEAPAEGQRMLLF